MKNKTNHGGYRSGSGRPLKYGFRTKMVRVPENFNYDSLLCLIQEYKKEIEESKNRSKIISPRFEKVSQLIEKIEDLL